MTTDGTNSITTVLLPLVIGWLLGILSTLLIDRVRKWLLKKEIKQGIITELREFEGEMTGLCSLTTPRAGMVTLEWSKWFRPFYMKLIESEVYDYIKELGKNKDQIAKWNDEEFFQMFKHWGDTEPPTTSLNYYELTTPYLNSHYDALSRFDEKFQLRILRLKKEIDLLNGYIKQSQFYHAKTFENISAHNHEIAVKNIRDSEKRIAARIKYIITLIESITK